MRIELQEKIYAQQNATFVVRRIKDQIYLFVHSSTFLPALGQHYALDNNGLDFYLLPSELHRIKNIVNGGCHAFILGFDENNQCQVWGVGMNWDGELGLEGTERLKSMTKLTLPESLIEIDHIAAGDDYSMICGRNAEGKIEIFATGHNDSAQLGTGNKTDQTKFTPCEVPDDLNIISGILAGKIHTIIWGLDENKNPKIWGTGSRMHCTFSEDAQEDNKKFRAFKRPKGIKEIKQVCSTRHNKDFGLYHIVWGIDQNEKPQIWMHDFKYKHEEECNPFQLLQLPETGQVQNLL